MEIKHNQILIPSENPFENCKLDREKYANVLTNIIDSYSTGFVLALNNQWGAGKTTFIKMWQQDLINKEYQTIYFNAWENDFEDNPLTALMGELKALTKSSTKEKFKKTLKNAAVLSKHVAPVIAKAIADKYINTDSLKEAIVGITNGLSDIFENEVNEYSNKKKGIQDFRESLSEYISSVSEDKPLIFIVDELDRCRPNYAVSILEQIKHFFTVQNIVFILSIDKTQLGSAIKGVYGSESIDSTEYLRRFIDIEYSIPYPAEDIFYKYLYDYFKFDEFFQSSERRSYSELTEDKRHFLSTCKLLFSKNNITLRQQEKIFSLARLALRSFRNNEYVVPHIFLFLSFVKINKEEFYKNLINKKLSISEVQAEFLSIIESSLYEETESELLWLEVYLINFYHNYVDNNYHKEKLFELNKELGENELKFDSIINKSLNKQFVRFLEGISRVRGEGNLDLSYFIKRIELIEDIK